METSGEQIIQTVTHYIVPLCKVQLQAKLTYGERHQMVAASGSKGWLEWNAEKLIRVLKLFSALFVCQNLQNQTFRLCASLYISLKIKTFIQNTYISVFFGDFAIYLVNLYKLQSQVSQ